MKALVICARRYNGHELWTSLGIIHSSGIEFDLVSTDYIIQDEITMQPNKITRLVDDVDPDKVSEYQGVMIVSGNMADTENYWNYKRVLSIFDKANEANLAIAAVCCSVPTVRNVAGGKKVSFFPLVRSRDLLLRAGAILQTVALTRDQNLVTAEHQMATQMWAEEFVGLIKGEPPVYVLQDSGFVPRGNERKPIPIIEQIKHAQRAAADRRAEEKNV